MHKNHFSIICIFVAFCTFSNILNSADILIEGKGAYFYSTSNTFRKIYSGGGLYGVEISSQMFSDFYGWISADYFNKKGSSIGSHDSTKIFFTPLGLGIKYLLPVDFVDFYLGVGVLGTYVHIKDDSPYVIHTSAKWGVGGIGKFGIFFNFAKHFFVDIFTNYYYTKIDFHNTRHQKIIRHDADLSGFSFGGGLGFRFG